MTGSGETGNVGVYLMSVCQKRMLDDMGISVTIVRAGRKKVSANPFEELTDEAKAEMQSRVDDTMDEFIRAVAKGRSMSQTTVRESFGDGSVFGARRALQMGAVDKICSLVEVLDRYGSVTVAPSPSNSSSSAIVGTDFELETRRRKLKLHADLSRDTLAALPRTQDKRLGSLHEAGHLFVALHFGASITKATMYPDGHIIFEATGIPSIDAAITYGGSEAAKGDLSDSDRACLAQLCPDPEERAKGLYMARKLISENTKAVQALADELLCRVSMTGRQAREFLASIKSR